MLLPITLGAQKKDYTSEQIRAAYEGTWKYENSNTKELFIMRLKYLPLTDDWEGGFIENFYGFFSYSKNGKVVYNNLSDTTLLAGYTLADNIDIDTELKISIDGSVSEISGDAAFSFCDFLRENKTFKYFKVKAQRIDKNNKLLYWDMNQLDETALNLWPKSELIPGSEYPEGCTIPMKMTLTRVK